jgi:1-acyl-sn-glycerol-3-phosphate acyltransferase
MPAPSTLERPSRVARVRKAFARLRVQRIAPESPPTAPPPPDAAALAHALRVQPGRVRLRTFLLAAWTIFVYGLWACCRPFALWQDGPLRPVRRALLKLWGRGALRMAGVRLRIEGPVPAPPFFLVSNHLSYLDIFVLARCTGAVFVGMDEIGAMPVIGYMVRTAQQLLIDRKTQRDAARVIPQIEAILKAGDGVVVFAEARCSRGVDVRPFKPSLFEPAVRLGLPVHCATLHYATPQGCPAAGDSMVWWRWESFTDHLPRLLSLPRSEARVRFAPLPVAAADRKALARACHAVVAEAFEPIAQGVLEDLPPPDDAPKHIYTELGA